MNLPGQDQFRQFHISRPSFFAAGHNRHDLKIKRPASIGAAIWFAQGLTRSRFQF